MSRKALNAYRLSHVAVAAVIAATTLAGLTATGSAHTAVAAPMAKCIPGSGNPLNPCPSP